MNLENFKFQIVGIHDQLQKRNFTDFSLYGLFTLQTFRLKFVRFRFAGEAVDKDDWCKVFHRFHLGSVEYFFELRVSDNLPEFCAVKNVATQQRIWTNPHRTLQRRVARHLV